MTILYNVTIKGQTHLIRVAVPEGAENHETLRKLALIAACLEGAGYLASGVTTAVE